MRSVAIGRTAVFCAMPAVNDMDAVYRKWTVHRKTKYGYSIRCKKGLWRVTAPTKEISEREAKHYFALYFCDGEYA